MKAILFHAIKPQDTRVREWRHFCQEASIKVWPSKEIDWLSENVLLINEDSPLVDTLFEIAQKYGISSRTLIFDLEAEWQDHHPRAPV